MEPPFVIAVFGAFSVALALVAMLVFAPLAYLAYRRRRLNALIVYLFVLGCAELVLWLAVVACSVWLVLVKVLWWGVRAGAW